jgi:hypothetical protein
MPRPPVTAGSIATCGHVATGVPRVLIENKPASAIGVSFAGGPIIGPGSPQVLVEGVPISVFGDFITPHGEYAHTAATMTTTVTRVLVP